MKRLDRRLELLDALKQRRCIHDTIVCVIPMLRKLSFQLPALALAVQYALHRLPPSRWKSRRLSFPLENTTEHSCKFHRYSTAPETSSAVFPPKFVPWNNRGASWQL